MRYVAYILTVISLCFGSLQPAQAACTGGACVYGDGGLAAIETGNGTILGPVLNALLGQDALDVGVINHQALAEADVNLGLLIPLLQAELALAEPEQVLDADIDLLSFIAVSADALEADGNLVAANILRALPLAIPGIEGIRIPLGFLNLDFDQGSFVDVDINVLNILTWGIQLFNYENAATTPTPLKLDNSQLPPIFQAAGLVNEAEIFIQVVEPPNFGCSQVGTVFRSPAMRVKINLDLVDNSLSSTPVVNGLLALLGPVADIDADIRLADLNVYLEIGSTTATVNRVGVLPPFAELAVEPSVAHAWIGHIDDEVFFNEQRAINTEQDLSYGEVAGLGLRLGVLGGDVVNFGNSVSVRSHSTESGSAELLQFFGPFPETQRSSGGAASVSRLLSNLIANLDIRVDVDGDGPDEGGGVLDDVLDALNTTLDVVLETTDEILDLTLGTLLRTVVEPTLEFVVDTILQAVGIYLAQAEYTVAAVYEICDISGRVYEDQNHDGRAQATEGVPAISLWAKRRNVAGEVEVVPVDPSNGSYRFTDVVNSPQSIIIDDNDDPSDFTPNLPAGWIGTRPESLRYDLTSVPRFSGAVDFGLFNGGRIDGSVFIDNGVDSDGQRRNGANNGMRESHERGLSDSLLVLLDAQGSEIDRARSGGDGRYRLWLPASRAGAVQLRQFNRLPYLSTGAELGNSNGSYDRNADSIAFNADAGQLYGDFNFGDVVGVNLRPEYIGYVNAGGEVVYAHQFLAGSEGQLNLTVSNVPAGWQADIWQDTNCNSRLDAEDSLVSESLAVASASIECLLLRVRAPAGADDGDQAAISLGGEFVFTGAIPPLSRSVSVLDTTIVSSNAAGIRLDKLTNKSQAKPGETVRFTLRYVNTSSQSIRDLTIEDREPEYTSVISQACNDTPASITDCQTEIDGKNLRWQLSGELVPGSEGSVSFEVRLDN